MFNSKNGPFYVNNKTTLIQVRSGLFKHFSTEKSLKPKTTSKNKNKGVRKTIKSLIGVKKID